MCIITCLYPLMTRSLKKDYKQLFKKHNNKVSLL